MPVPSAAPINCHRNFPLGRSEPGDHYEAGARSSKYTKNLKTDLERAMKTTSPYYRDYHYHYRVGQFRNFAHLLSPRHQAQQITRSPAVIQRGHYCLSYNEGGSDCSFTSYAQCQASAFWPNLPNALAIVPGPTIPILGTHSCPATALLKDMRCPAIFKKKRRTVMFQGVQTGCRISAKSPGSKPL